jgi:hypothetical protein
VGRVSCSTDAKNASMSRCSTLRKAAKAGDPEYLRAARLFVAEEQQHAALLLRLLGYLGGMLRDFAKVVADVLHERDTRLYVVINC